jgi:2-amino-4-hydroxy-6-hydroxymethyldihydropteridine diphosphokinase
MRRGRGHTAEARVSHLRARTRRVLRDPVKAFLGLGSNQGDRARMLARARDLLAGPDLHIARASHVYESAPWGVTDQPWFLNQVLEVRTALAPHPLLERCRGVETRLGRVRPSRWGPRTIDVDILLYDDVVMSTAALTIPHRRLRERAFVLIPLAEIDPGLRLPGGERIADLLAGLPDQGSVRAFLVPAGEDDPAVADAMPSPRMPG